MLLALAVALLQQSAASPDTVAPPRIAISRRAATIQIDGHLDEPDWQAPPSATELTQSNPREGAPATERSEFWIRYDDDAIYVAARFHDSAPDSIISYLVRRDGTNQSDLFSVFLDPYLDGQSGYQFLVNAAGVQRDAALFNDNQSDVTWDGVWESAVGRFAGGWTTEVRIPLSQLRLRDTPRQVWGVNFARGIGRRNEFSYTVPRRRAGSGFVSRFARLEGMEGVRPRRRLEALPYLLGRSRFGDAAPDDPFFDGSRQSATAGVDVRAGLGELQLDFTVNPDFGQVEVDPAVVNLTDFETRFQERRPFFVEGTNVFRFGGGGLVRNLRFDWPVLEPFYSRRIGAPPTGRVGPAEHADVPGGVRILGAGKLTGKLGAWNVAALSALTNREHARTATGGIIERQEVEPLGSHNVARLQRDFAGGRRGVGLLATHVARDFEAAALRNVVGSRATFGGADGWLTLDADREWVLSGWGGWSRVEGDPAAVALLQRSAGHYFQRPDADHVRVDPAATALDGGFARLQLNRQRGAVLFNAAIGAISPGFDVNDAGFVSGSDVVNAHVASGHLWTEPGDWYLNAGFTVGAFSSWDFGGNRTRTGLNPEFNVLFRNYTNAYLGLQATAEGRDNRATRGGPAIRQPETLEMFGGWGSDFRRAFQYGVNLAGSSRGDGSPIAWTVHPYIQWRPSESLTLQFAPGLSRQASAAQYLRTVPDPLATTTYGHRYLFGELDQRTLFAELRADWIFSPRSSLQLFVQPLVSSVRYGAVRELLAPNSLAFRTMGTDGSTIDRSTGIVDPDGDGPASPFSIGQPDFTFASLRGNAVFRWEYQAGSTLYLVWTQQRQHVERIGSFRPGQSLGDLFDAGGENVLLLKLSYWLSR